MPSTNYTGRRPIYIENYARAVSAAARYEDLLATVREEQDRVAYLDSLITAENQTKAALTETFRARPVDLSQVKALLRSQYAIDDAARQRAAGAVAARVAAESLPAQELAILNTALGTGSRAETVRVAKELADRATPQRAAAIITKIASTGILPAGELQQLQEQISQRTAAYKGGRVAVDGRQQEAVSAAMDVLLSSAPLAIRGGYAGREIADLRRLTATALKERAEISEDAAMSQYLANRATALEDSEFATAEEAFQAALEIVRATGDPSAIQDQFARDIYEEAREKQAYQNDQRADFEEEVLASRQRLAELESRRASSPGAQYDDPAREVYRRELEARGFDFERNDGRYVQYQQSPYYESLIKADDMVRSVLDTGAALEAVDQDQRLARDLLQALDRAGKPYDIETLRKKLGKTMEGERLDDAIAFALAFKEQTTRGLDNPSQLERQRKLEETQRRQQESAKASASARANERRGEEERLRNAEEKAKTAPPSDQFASRFYANRLRGMSMEDASREARGVAPASAIPTTSRRPREPRTVQPDAAPVAPIAPVAPAPVRIADPTNPAFEFERTEAGDYIVYRDGRRTGRAVQGSRAFRSIESVLSGGPALSPPPPAPVVDEAPELVFEPIKIERETEGFSRRPGETDQQYERRLLGE